MHRVERLMRKRNIKAARGYKAQRASVQCTFIIAPNHLRRAFTVDKFNKVRATDITYARTWQGRGIWQSPLTSMPARLWVAR